MSKVFRMGWCDVLTYVECVGTIGNDYYLVRHDYSTGSCEIHWMWLRTTRLRPTTGRTILLYTTIGQGYKRACAHPWEVFLRTSFWDKIHNSSQKIKRSTNQGVGCYSAQASKILTKLVYKPFFLPPTHPDVCTEHQWEGLIILRPKQGISGLRICLQEIYNRFQLCVTWPFGR